MDPIIEESESTGSLQGFSPRPLQSSVEQAAFTIQESLPVAERMNSEGSPLLSSLPSSRQASLTRQSMVSPPRSTSSLGSRSGSSSKREFTDMSEPITLDLNEDDASSFAALRAGTSVPSSPASVRSIQPDSGGLDIGGAHGDLKQKYTKVMAEKRTLEREVRNLGDHIVKQTSREADLVEALRQEKIAKHHLQVRVDGFDQKYDGLNDVCNSMRLENEELKQKSVVASRNEHNAFTQMRSLKLLNAGLTSQVNANKHNLKQAQDDLDKATRVRKSEEVQKFIRNEEILALQTDLLLAYEQIQLLYQQQSELSVDLFYQGVESGDIYSSAQASPININATPVAASASTGTPNKDDEELPKEVVRGRRKSSPSEEPNLRSLDAEAGEEYDEESSSFTPFNKDTEYGKDSASPRQEPPAANRVGSMDGGQTLGTAEGVAITAVRHGLPHVVLNSPSHNRVTDTRIETDEKASSNSVQTSPSLTYSDSGFSSPEVAVTTPPSMTDSGSGKHTALLADTAETQIAGLGISFDTGSETRLASLSKRSGFLPRPLLNRTVSEPRLDAIEASELDFLPATTYTNPNFGSGSSNFTKSFRSTPPPKMNDTETEPFEYASSPSLTPARQGDARTLTSPAATSESGSSQVSSTSSSSTDSSRPELSPGEVNTKDFAQAVKIIGMHAMTKPSRPPVLEDQGTNETQTEGRPNSVLSPPIVADKPDERLSLNIPSKGQPVDAKQTASQTRAGMPKMVDQGMQTAAQTLSNVSAEATTFGCLPPNARPSQDVHHDNISELLKSEDQSAPSADSQSSTPVKIDERDIPDTRRSSLSGLVIENVRNFFSQLYQSSRVQTPGSAMASTPGLPDRNERAKPSFNIWTVIFWVTMVIILARVFVNERMFWMNANEPTRQRVRSMRDEHWNSVMVEKVLYSVERYIVREGVELG